MASSEPSKAVESIEPSPLLDNLPQEILEIVLNVAVDSFETIQERQKERIKQRKMARSWFEVRKVVKEFWTGDIETVRGVLAELERSGMGDAVKMLEIKLAGKEMDRVVAEIIRKCSNIERMMVQLDGVYSWAFGSIVPSTHTHTFSAIAQLSNLKSLDLKVEKDSCFMVEGSSVSQIITNCTKLQHLRLPPIFSPLPPASASLSSLAILLGSDSNLRAIDPLIRGSTTLRKLEIRVGGIGMDGPFDTIDADFCDLLSTLPYLDHLIYTDGPGAEEFIKTMSKVTSITRLELKVDSFFPNPSFLEPLSKLKHVTINCLNGQVITDYTEYSEYFKEFTTTLETFTIKHEHKQEDSCREIEAAAEIQGLIEALGDTKFSQIYV